MAYILTGVRGNDEPFGLAGERTLKQLVLRISNHTVQKECMCVCVGGGGELVQHIRYRPVQTGEIGGGGGGGNY